MSPSWNFPARAEPSYKGFEPSRAKLGHFSFRAENELTIPISKKKFPQVLLSEVLYHDFN